LGNNLITKAMIIYFTRHGETIWNKKRILQGFKDSSLTSRGIRSAEKKGKILNKKDIEIIYSSDLGRCLRTAKIINKWLKSKLIKAKQLRERNFGNFNGYPDKKIKKLLNLDNPAEKAPHGESFNEQKNRVLLFLKKLSTKKYKKVLLIIHDGTARAILSEYYKTNFSSQKCDTSNDKIYSMEIYNDKLKKFKIL